MELTINGKNRTFELLETPTMMDTVLRALELRGDRIAVELNGELAPRATWASLPVRDGDKLEVVHFVGGGR